MIVAFAVNLMTQTSTALVSTALEFRMEIQPKMSVEFAMMILPMTMSPAPTALAW
jgi:hypothetical protein